MVVTFKRVDNSEKPHSRRIGPDRLKRDWASNVDRIIH
jgi:hypothetical protein